MVENSELTNEKHVEEEKESKESGVYTRDHYAKADFWDDRFKE